MEKNLYDILGVSKDATEQQISKAYKKLAVKYHPDKQVGKSDQEKKEAEEKFKEATKAYEILTDKDKRQKYDTFGTIDGNIPNMGGYSNPFTGGGFPDIDIADLFGYGRGRAGAQANRHAPGKDIRMTVPLTLEDIYNGCKKTLKYKKNIRCAFCHGDGGTGKKTCPRCGGTGQAYEVRQTAFGIAQQVFTCPECKGTGFITEHKCDKCKGTGFSQKDATVTVEFPAGIQYQNGLQIPGAGHESSDKLGSDGCFIAIADYAFDTSKFKIDGYDVYEYVEIPYYDLLLGCEKEIKLPNGQKRKVKISECTPDRKKIRLYRDGIAPKNTGLCGDYYIIIKAVYPDTLLKTEREHLEKIKAYKSKISKG